MSPALFHWPEIPSLPPIGEPVVVRVATDSRRAVARQQLRDAARIILGSWAALSPAQIQLRETERGPVYTQNLGGAGIALSFSYCENAGWIALLRGTAVGIDALRVQPFAEMESVAASYLGPDALAAVAADADPPRRFARAWTAFEATLKLTGRTLIEWRAASVVMPTTQVREYSLERDDTIVTLVTHRDQCVPSPCRASASM
jgi:phosphopantetheinyl transferase